MKTVIGGNGQDTTAAAQAHLRSNAQVWQAHLYLLGEADDPNALWLTDWESPLVWTYWGTFLPTVITRSEVKSQIGLEAEAVTLSWSPQNTLAGVSGSPLTPYQRAEMGYYDRKRVRIWRTIMPAPGDANTFGAYELWGGFIGDVLPELAKIDFQVESSLHVLDQQVPSGVIETTATTASYTGFTVPAGWSVFPEWSTVGGSTQGMVLCDQTSPNPGDRPTHDTLNGFYVVFDGGPLKGQVAIIGRNQTYTDGNGVAHVQLFLDGLLPFAPTPGRDTFFISGSAKVTGGDPGFPYVPASESAV